MPHCNLKRAVMLSTGIFLLALAGPAAVPADWLKARDAQDRAALDRIAAEASAQAQAKKDATSHYLAALAENYRAEVAMEKRDKNASRAAAENGIALAQKAVELEPKAAEFHRILGTLCAQVIPANVLAGLKYGRCAMDEVNKAVELDPKSSMAYLSRGVGNYYLPEQFGGGVANGLADIDKAIALNGKNADAYVWRGVVLRKLGRNAEARKAFEQAMKLSPARLWAKEQMEKTPAQ